MGEKVQINGINFDVVHTATETMSYLDAQRSYPDPRRAGTVVARQGKGLAFDLLNDVVYLLSECERYALRCRRSELAAFVGGAHAA